MVLLCASTNDNGWRYAQVLVMGWPFHTVHVPQGWTGSRWTRCGDVWHRILPAPMTASPGSSTRPRARTIMHWEWRPSATSSWKRWVQVQTGLWVYLWRLDVLQEHCLLLLCCLISSDVSWHIRDKLRPVCEHSSVLLYIHRNHKARLDGEPRTATLTLTQLLNSVKISEKDDWLDAGYKFFSKHGCGENLLLSSVSQLKLWQVYMVDC